MDRRLVTPLLCAAAIVYACGPRPHAGASRLFARGARAEAAVIVTRAAPPHRPIGARRDTAATPIEASLSVYAGDEVRFALTVVNESDKRVEINFPDGQTRDYAVFDADGREVWRWSRGRLFTQAMQNKLLSAGDSVVYEERWPAPRAGRYSVVALLRSDNYPARRTASFSVSERAQVAVR